MSEQELLSDERLPFAVPPPQSDRQWLLAEPPMRDLAVRHVGSRPKVEHFERLLAALLSDPEQGAFRYDATATLSAADAFEQRRGNCLAFAALVVSLARAAGYDARFQRVEMPPDWNLRDNTMVTRLHINTRVRFQRGRAVEVDWRPGRGLPAGRRELLSDTEALAEYHNNLGVEAMLAGDRAAAFAELRHAARLAPEIAHIWSNLAVYYRRAGDAAAAEAAWLQALQRDPEALPALSALQRLYAEQGRGEMERAIGRKVQAYRDNNPFYHYLQARTAFENGDMAIAQRKLDTALSLRNDERFKALQARIEERRRSEVAVASGG